MRPRKASPAFPAPRRMRRCWLCSAATTPAGDWPPWRWRAAAVSAPRCRRCCKPPARQMPRSAPPRSTQPLNLASESDLPALLALLSIPDTAADLPVAERTLIAVCGRAGQADACAGKLVGRLAGAPPPFGACCCASSARWAVRKPCRQCAARLATRTRKSRARPSGHWRNGATSRRRMTCSS